MVQQALACVLLRKNQRPFMVVADSNQVVMMATQAILELRPDILCLPGDPGVKFYPAKVGEKWLSADDPLLEKLKVYTTSEEIESLVGKEIDSTGLVGAVFEGAATHGQLYVLVAVADGALGVTPETSTSARPSIQCYDNGRTSSWRDDFLKTALSAESLPHASELEGLFKQPLPEKIRVDMALREQWLRTGEVSPDLIDKIFVTSANPCVNFLADVVRRITNPVAVSGSTVRAFAQFWNDMASRTPSSI